MRLVGLDLAWSSRNPTGAAVLEGDPRAGRLLDSRLLGPDDEVVAYVESWAEGGPVLVAIDAPLVVPNETGRRPAETEISAVFARYQAGAHPANRSRLAVYGVVRGEAIVARLEALGFTHRPEVVALEPVRQVVEVYPHPAIVSIFGLSRILQYKARPKRTLETRLAEFARYAALLRSLKTADPALTGADALLERDLAGLRLAELKGHEDRLDGVMCAYVALYLWRWGIARARVFGTLEEGSITTPVPPALWADPPAPKPEWAKQKIHDQSSCE